MKEQSIQQRIMGIDFGSHRVGISVSDPLQIIAVSLETIENTRSLLPRIKELVVREDVGLVVVGMPFNLKGEKGVKGQEVDRFVLLLKSHLTVEVVTWDERFTSTLAHSTMRQMGTKKKERRTDKGRIDAMAAAIMLQSYLDSRKRSLSC